ncbi:hypothetical protein COCSADRAFT_302835 [Bipolaris sorokiniana ND90Pr]|uniref:Uncharacterized protein n=1 Tax=Cochliobolus sativus (strain ND90Pr / ATCC 201652) TaxID=665912 RepID=M2TC89_COCSN|nr:uncharacterized protein COCSADRAFT_302835 [Bipolaris sorokiniana ND90Pr]EMD66821.1 hypothetical protein COCSADRAFT_302835 [Bipolaris sorokiniana ND90Pr]
MTSHYPSPHGTNQRLIGVSIELHFIATIFFAPSLDFASVLTTRTRHMMVAAMQCRDNRGVVGLPLAEAPAAKGHLHLHTFRHVLNNLR